jgi:hypothetical protein
MKKLLAALTLSASLAFASPAAVQLVLPAPVVQAVAEAHEEHQDSSWASAVIVAAPALEEITKYHDPSEMVPNPLDRVLPGDDLAAGPCNVAY